MDGANAVVGGGRDAGWVSPEALQRDLQGMVDGLAEQIMGAVNGARKGQLSWTAPGSLFGLAASRVLVVVYWS